MSTILQATNLAWSDSTATSDFEKMSGYTLLEVEAQLKQM
jgi:hypothetical protein